MGDRALKGFLTIWTEIDEDYMDEFQRWHNCEHMTERVSIPGFHVGRRYRGADNASIFMCYETADPSVLKSEPYLKALNNPTPWTRRSLLHFKNTIRNIYRVLEQEGRSAPTESPYLFLARLNVASGADKEWAEWYTNRYLPRICDVPGVYRGTLYEIDEEVSNIMTAERHIYGAGPGQQRYLAVYEIDSLDLPSGQVWKEAGQADPLARDIFQKTQDVQEGLFWLEFVLYAPGLKRDA